MPGNEVAYIVVDIGKTLSKVSGWSRNARMIDRTVRPNPVVTVDGIRRLDAGGIGTWLIEALRTFAGQPVEAIVPVAHGGGFAAIGNDGLLFTPFDYEQPLPANIMAAYRAERDDFAVNGSPALPDGLNLGAQIYWAERLHPELIARAALVPWAQYWAWFLTGHLASEVTSLGCHTDLWHPAANSFSPMAKRLGWADRFAPLARAGDAIGTLRPGLAAQTGLPATAKVLAGLHDTNAALLAARSFREIAKREATIMSTGTWFVAMRLTQEAVPAEALSERRDTLVNIDARGAPTPSARFMGGREIEAVIEIDTRRVDIKPDQPKLLAEVPALLARRTMMLPTLAPGCGPFPQGQARWLNAPGQWKGTWYARRAAICLYAALVADTALDLIGSKGRLLIEGRFAESEVFVRTLAALRGDTKVYTANAHNDVSFGALRLLDPQLEPQGELCRVEPLEGDFAAYRATWHTALAQETS